MPVAGLDDLGSDVVESTTGFGIPPRAQPFVGHVTLARGRNRRPIPAHLVGQRIGASWTVDRLALVRSRLGADGARYEVVATTGLAG